MKLILALITVVIVGCGGSQAIIEPTIPTGGTYAPTPPTVKRVQLELQDTTYVPDIQPTPIPTVLVSQTDRLIPIYSPPPGVSAASSYATGLIGGNCSFGPHLHHPNPYCPDVIWMLAQYSWELQEAIAVMNCESMGDANAVSSGGCIGLFQICGAGEPSQYFDPGTNIAAAWWKYTDGLAKGNRWYHWNNFGACGHYY